MDTFKAYFKSCHLYFRSYLVWQTPNQNIREYHMGRAKVDMEIARALLNVDRKRRIPK